MTPILGLLTIGQTPRPDLEAEFRRLAPSADIRMVGALDGLRANEIDELASGDTSYPLLTRLADMRTVTVDLVRLLPFVESAVTHLSNLRPTLIVLLCARDFPRLVARVAAELLDAD